MYVLKASNEQMLLTGGYFDPKEDVIQSIELLKKYSESSLVAQAVKVLLNESFYVSIVFNN